MSREEFAAVVTPTGHRGTEAQRTQKQTRFGSSLCLRVSVCRRQWMSRGSGRPFAGVVIITAALLASACAANTRATRPDPNSADPVPSTPAALAASRTPLQQLSDDISAATRRQGVQRAVWGVVVQSLERDERLFELNPQTLLVPASTAKLVSVAAAVDAVGWDYRFETTLRTNGMLSDGVLHGDLVITGSGDPSIGGRGGEDFASWIAALKSMGIRRIEGSVIGDDDAIEEPRRDPRWPGRGTTSGIPPARSLAP
jgi:D-alanyl-D-alanine carboxypeptidase